MIKYNKILSGRFTELNVFYFTFNLFLSDTVLNVNHKILVFLTDLFT